MYWFIGLACFLHPSVNPADTQKLEKEERICRSLHHPNISKFVMSVNVTWNVHATSIHQSLPMNSSTL